MSDLPPGALPPEGVDPDDLPPPVVDADNPLSEFLPEGVSIPTVSAEVDDPIVGVPQGVQLERGGYRYRQSHLVEPFNWSPAKRARIKRMLERAGLTKVDERTKGVWTDDDGSAWSTLLGAANQMGLEWERLLDRWMKSPVKVGDDDPVIELPNPADQARQVRSSLTGAIGHAPPTKVAELTDRYRDLQRQDAGRREEMERRAAEGEELPDEIDEMPSLDTFVEETQRQENPGEFGGHKMMDFFARLTRMAGVAG